VFFLVVEMSDMKKKGEVGISQIISGFFILMVVLFVILTAVNYSKTSDFGSALDNTSEGFKTFFEKILTPLFSSLLNLDQAVNNKLLVVLTFILLSVILVGTLDTVSIFGEDNKGRIINITIGVIMSIIATRYMPGNLWDSLVSPTVALVPTMLIALPFAALIILSMRIKNNLGIKVLWLGYALFMTYLTFFIDGSWFSGGMANGGMKWIYFIFFCLALVMLFFDATVRRYLRQEKVNLDLAKGLSVEALSERARLQGEIKEKIGLRNQFTSKSQDYKDMTKNIEDLKKKVKELGKF